VVLLAVVCVGLSSVGCGSSPTMVICNFIIVNQTLSHCHARYLWQPIKFSWSYSFHVYDALSESLKYISDVHSSVGFFIVLHGELHCTMLCNHIIALYRIFDSNTI